MCTILGTCTFDFDLKNYSQGLVAAYSYDGTQYFVPHYLDTSLIFYNKDIFGEYGVEYPTDDWAWEEFYEVYGKLTDPENNLRSYCINIYNQCTAG